MSIALKVESYSGYKADERPLRFTSVTRGGQTYQVVEILDQWYGVGYQCFKIRADDRNIYILWHSETNDAWTLDAFRRGSDS
jgi:hypothetical protein